MKTIHFIRHGQTEWNKEGRLQGWLNSPLTELGKQQASELQGRFKVEAVFCSDLGRAVETANAAFPYLQPTTLPELREIYLGDWQGETIEGLQQDPHYMTYVTNPAQFVARSQESFGQVRERMLKAWSQIIASEHSQIVIVGHGVALYCLLLALHGEQLVTFDHKWMLESCGYTTFYVQESQRHAY